MKLLRNNGLFWLGLNNERLLNFTGSLLEGLTFYEVDTNRLYQVHYGVWVLVNSPSTGSSIALNIRTITTSDTILWNDYTILADAALGVITVSLPTALSVDKQIFNIKKIDNSGNWVNVLPFGAELIDGNSIEIIRRKNSNVQFQSNGINWYIL